MDAEPGTVRLTNADFRKLLMTPRAPSSSSAAASAQTPAATTPGPKSSKTSSSKKSSERHEARKKKKHFYAQMKKHEDNTLQELAEKYRDRARERRDGTNSDYQGADLSSTTTSAYRTVAPDMKSGYDQAERRRQLIQESKFLGGDMEHTHLVKGLDYALLQKVRSEIETTEAAQEEEMERLAKEQHEEQAKEEKAKEEESDELKFKSVLAKNIHRFVTMQRSRIIEKNELFAPGRMAYLIELEDDNVETDIPTTVIRSKAEVPQESQEAQTLSTNDIVINKLSQILSYLRQGGKGKKNKRRDKDKPLFKMPAEKTERNDDSIYDDIGEYKPERERRERERERDRDRDRDHRRDRDRSSRDKPRYFDNYRDKEKDETIMAPPPPPKLASAAILSKLTAEPEGYAECYPGLEEMNDAIDDSDDEVDYTKMDLGNKKGPIGRWDFDTQEEYSDYMSKKEALPKAAFQYGVKMQDGRRTRKHKTEKSEKAELDREWQKIQNIIHKRKTNAGSEGPSAKLSKY